MGDCIRILAQVRKHAPAHLLMVGDGPERCRPRNASASASAAAVTFLGTAPAVEEVVAGADLFLLPSENESFGLAGLAELALACEVPVVGARGRHPGGR